LRRICFVTCRTWPEISESDRLVQRALEARGATVEARGRPRIRLRLVAARRVVASARGSGRASLRTRVRARTYRLLVSTTSHKPLQFALTISYPAASS